MVDMNGMISYIVGGYVRDFIMGFSSNDIDYVVIGETEESMIKRGFKKVGADFAVFLHPKTGEEYALARTEKKEGVGYNGFSTVTEGISLEEDLGRRDLTINAIAMTDDGQYIDPYDGLLDIKHKVLRHTTSAFSEDPVRVLRLARFTARFVDFVISEETKILARSLKDELRELTPERVFKELEKALKSEKPSNYFRALFELDALEIVHPEIFAMIGVPQRFDYHAEGDVFEHTMRVLDEMSSLTDNPVARYAAIYHDIGKPITYKENGNFYGHGDIDVIFPAFNILKEKKHPNIYIKAATMVAEWHTFVHGFSTMKTKTLVKKMTSKTFPKKIEDFEMLLMASGADEKGRILGNRTLSFDETEFIFNGGEIEGFRRRDFPSYENEMKIFEAISKKVHLPKEVIEGPVIEIKNYIYREKLRRAKKIL